ncbi:BQ2448_1643 [Microbotryum intermedium]|uniref:BQ2448_1643 protein n=1 Tax=Microbotryum intermedium TaxID=269621 RepID=A0A238FBT6_9BASI|nr:BQ2448_1643 [Microbotryum intermedium]
MSHLHPLAAPLLPYLQKYPSQATSLFQAYQDLYLAMYINLTAQTWQDLEVLDLPSCECAVLKGRPQNKIHWCLPQKTSNPQLNPRLHLNSLANVFKALDELPSEQTPSTSSPTETPAIYLAIAERDSSIVYYVLKEGIVSPKEVPE